LAIHATVVQITADNFLGRGPDSTQSWKDGLVGETVSLLRLKSELVLSRLCRGSVVRAFGGRSARFDRERGLGDEMPGIDRGHMELLCKAGPDGNALGDCPFCHYIQMILRHKASDLLSPTSLWR
jgi:hypothetical protein